MDWVEGLEKRNGRYLARVARVGESTKLVDFEAKHLTALTAPRLYRSRIETDFKTWSVSSAKEYLSGFSVNLEVEERHQVFAITLDGVRYLIPSLILMKAIFRPFQQLSNFLFVPQGLERLCIPDLCVKNPSVHLMPGTLDTHSRRTATIRQPMSWFWCFPTARNLWDSVYRSACDGKLGIDLPEGRVRLVAKGKQLAQTCYVTECSIIQIATEEQPYEFAGEHRRLITFHAGTDLGDARRGKRSRPTPLSDRSLSPRDGTWYLSDDEWAAIQAFATTSSSHSNSTRKHDLRCVLDGIIEKVGAGIPWKKMHYKSGDWRNAQWQYRKLLLSGQWENIRKVLSETRAPNALMQPA